jgi:DNA-binding Lrp family transcriptional regulator
MDEIDRAIVNGLQGGLSVCEQPYLEAAQRLGLTEDELLRRLAGLLADGVLTRVGPLFQIEKMGGAFTLAALHAEPEEYERVATLVNALPQVAHNYAREHALNMWFVLATETPQQIDQVLARIQQETGCAVFNFPKSREYFVELKLHVRAP